METAKNGNFPNPENNCRFSDSENIYEKILLMTRDEIRNFISVAIDYLDMTDGDCDLEESEETESDGDDQDSDQQSYLC